MDDRISQTYIYDAVDALIDLLGVKENVQHQDMVKLLKGKLTQLCIQSIAKNLELDLTINLTYIPKTFIPGNSNKFETSQLSRTDWTGRGIESITAQVQIPPNIPVYGTSSFKGFPINVRVSEGCNESGFTFISVMAHELSHVLLHSLKYPQMNNEIYTDITPLVLGFSNIVETGRKKITTTVSGNITTTHTLTFGYLTDDQFCWACQRIRVVLEKKQRFKKSLLKFGKVLNRQIDELKRMSKQFSLLLGYLDTHQKKTIKAKDVSSIVELHSTDHSEQLKSVIVNCENTISGVGNLTAQLSHYTKRTDLLMENYQRNIQENTKKIANIKEGLEKDIKVLNRNIGFGAKIEIALQKN